MNRKLLVCALLAQMAGSNIAVGAEGKSLESAKKYLDKGETKAAVIELKNYLQDHPDNSEARLLMGDAYLKQGDAPSASKAFEKARDLKAPKEKWIVPLGQAYLLQNDTRSFFDAIKPDADLPGPVRAQVFGLIGSAYLTKGDETKAQDNFNAALKLDPGAPEALLGLAMLEAQRKNFKKTIEYAGMVVARDAKHVNGWVILGEAKRLDGDNQGAIDAFGKAIALRPNEVRARLGRATAYLGMNKTDEASKDVAEVRKQPPEIPLALYLQAVIDFQEKNVDEAQELLVKASAAMPDHLPTKLLLGTIAYQKGEYESAENQLSQFTMRIPDHIPAAKLLAATRLKNNRPADAVRALKAVEDKAKDDPQFLSLLGSAYLQTKEFDLGNEYLSRAAALDPKAAAIKAQLGLGQIASGNLDAAVADLKAAVELDQNLLQADVMLVLALIQDKKYDEAITAANKLKGKLKDDPLPENLLGAAYMAKADFDKAREHWNAALKLNPEYSTAALNLAKLELSLKNPDGAVGYFKKVLDRDPKNLAALIGLAQVAEARLDYDAMEKYLLDAREKNPKSIEPGLMLSRYYIVIGKPLQAMDIARSMDSSNPDNVRVMQNLATAQLANKQAASAVTTFKKLVNKEPANPEFHHQLAQTLYQSGDKAAAAAEWKALIKSSPDFIQSYLALAEIEVRQKEFDEALKYIETVKARQPKIPLLPQLEGDIEFSQKQYDKAVAAYQKSYELQPNSAAARGIFQARRASGNDKAAFEALTQWLKVNEKDADGWVMLGMGYQSLGKTKEAISAYEKAQALKPDNPVIMNNLAWVYQESGDKKALPLAEKLLPASENNPEIMDTVGWIFIHNGKVDKGLHLLQDAAVHAPQQVQIRIHVAEALVKSGRKDDARKELELLLKEKKTFPERARVEAMLKEL